MQGIQEWRRGGVMIPGDAVQWWYSWYTVLLLEYVCCVDASR